MTDDYEMVPGVCVRIRDFDELGSPELVVIRPQQARRSKYLRTQWLTVDGEELFCAVFKDSMTGAVYGQLAE